MSLTIQHIRALLENCGAVPDDLRRTAWRFLLALPDDVEYYDSLVVRGTHKDAHDLARLFPISDRRLLARLQKTCSALYYWSPDLASVSWLPQFIFPFVKFWDRDLVAAFETCVILLSTYQSWLQFRDVPPNREIIFVDSLSAKYTGKSGVGTERPADWAWRLFIGIFTDQLSGSEWLQFCDHWFCDGHRAFLYASLAAFPAVVPSRYLVEAMTAPYQGLHIGDFLRHVKKVLQLLRDRGCIFGQALFNNDEHGDASDSLASFLRARFKLIPVSGMRHMESIVLPKMTIVDYSKDLDLIEREQKEFLNIMKRAHFRDLADDPMDTRYSATMDSANSGTMDSSMSQQSLVTKAKQAIGISQSGLTNLRSTRAPAPEIESRARGNVGSGSLANLGNVAGVSQARAVHDNLARSALADRGRRSNTMTCEPLTPEAVHADGNLGSTFTTSALRPASQCVDQFGIAVQTEDVELVPVPTSRSQKIAEHIAREMAQDAAEADVQIRESTQAIEEDFRERRATHPAVQKSQSVVHQEPENTEHGFVVNLSERSRRRAELNEKGRQLIGRAVQNAILTSLTTVRACPERERPARPASNAVPAGPTGPVHARSTEFDLKPQPEPELCQVCEVRGVYDNQPAAVCRHTREEPVVSRPASATPKRPSSARKRPVSASVAIGASQGLSAKQTPKTLAARASKTVTIDTPMQTSRAPVQVSRRSLKNTPMAQSACSTQSARSMRLSQPVPRGTRSVATSLIKSAQRVDRSIGTSQPRSLKGSVGVQCTNIYDTESDTEETQDLVNKVDQVLSQARTMPRKELLELEQAPKDTLLGLIDTLERQVASSRTSVCNQTDSNRLSHGSDLIAEKIGYDPQLNTTHPEAPAVVQSIYLDEYDDASAGTSYVDAAAGPVDSVRFVPVASQAARTQRVPPSSMSIASTQSRPFTDASGQCGTGASTVSTQASHGQQGAHYIPLVPPHHSLHVTMPSVSGTHASERHYAADDQESGSTSPYTNSDNAKPSVSFMLPESTTMRDSHKSMMARREALESVSVSSGAVEPLNLNVHPSPQRPAYPREPGYPPTENEKDLTISSVQEPVLVSDVEGTKRLGGSSRSQITLYPETTTSTFLPQPSTSLYYSSSQQVGGQPFSHSTSLPVPSRSNSRTGSVPPQIMQSKSRSPPRVTYQQERSDSQITKVTGVEPAGYENSNTYAATMTNYEKSVGSMLHTNTQRNQIPVQVVIQDKDQSYTLGNKDMDTFEENRVDLFDVRGVAESDDLLRSVRRRLGEFRAADESGVTTTTLDLDPKTGRPFNGLLSSVARLGDTSAGDVDTRKGTGVANRLMDSGDYSTLEDPIVDTESPYRHEQTPLRPGDRSLTDLQNLTWNSAVTDQSVLEMLRAQTSPASNALYSSVRGYCNQMESTLASFKQGVDDVISKAGE